MTKMLIFFGFCIFQIHVASSQFPDHVDFQKEGEIFIKGEKFNILKLRKHIVKDHFLNFMQRRDAPDPKKRVFLDRNGLRHYWSGFNNEKNLRKSEADDNLSINIEDPNSDIQITRRNSENTGINETNKEAKNNVQHNKTKEEDETSKDETKNTFSNSKKKPKRKPQPSVVDKIIMKPALRADATGKTMAITHFYCPFFGVMSLSAYID